MKRFAKAVKKFIIAIIGFGILIIGLVLIPLPGPGILVTVLGLLILSWEFAWAERQLDKAKTAQRKIAEKAKQKRAPPTKPPSDNI